MNQSHEPDETRTKTDQWLLVLEPVQGGQPIILSTKPVGYDEARQLGLQMNQARNVIGYGFKITMVPVVEEKKP